MLGHRLLIVGDRVGKEKPRALGHLDQCLAALTQRAHHACEIRAGIRIDAQPSQMGTQVFGHIRGVGRFQIMLIEPEQLVGVEGGRRAVHRPQIEQRDHLGPAEHFLVPMRPAEPHQIVEQRLGQIAFVAVLQHADRAVALGQALAVGAQDHRHMGIGRRRHAERPQQVDLPRRVVDVVIAADDVRYPHVRIVHHHREVVGRRAVGAGDDEVVEFRVFEGDGPAHQILEHHLSIHRIAKPHHRAHALGWRVAPIAAQAVVARLFLGRHLFGAQGVQTLAAAIAMIGRPRGQHARNDLAVAIEAPGLVVRACVVFQAQPGHAFENGLNVFIGRTFPVRVLDAQDEASAHAARMEPGKKGRAGAPDVQMAGGAGGETGDDGHGASGLRAKARSEGGRAGAPMLAKSPGTAHIQSVSRKPRLRRLAMKS